MIVYDYSTQHYILYGCIFFTGFINMRQSYQNNENLK